MPEPYPRAEFQQSRFRRRCCSLDWDAQPLPGPPHQRRIAGRVGRRQPQKPAGLRRQSIQTPTETLLDLARQRPRAGKPEPACQLLRRKAPRQL
jgi:hypothetical protein